MGVKFGLTLSEEHRLGLLQISVLNSMQTEGRRNSRRLEKIALGTVEVFC
jgi:hypothetical protein